MRQRSLILLAGLAAWSCSAQAMTLERRATFSGHDDGRHGKCTIEVDVDGAADIIIRGDQGLLRTLSGEPAVWRRFVCSSPMPMQPQAFRFRGVDGRGSVHLIRDPRQGGQAVVRIEDPKRGREGYTFDLEWKGRDINGADRRYYYDDPSRPDRW